MTPLIYLSTKPAKFFLSMIILVSLIGCVAEEFDDLKEFVASVKAREPTPIKPLPILKEFETFKYESKGLRNPFRPMVKAKKSVFDGEKITGEGPDLGREKEELEAFPLDTLRMVGTLEQKGQMWGLVKAGNGIIHRVSTGQFMGRNFGEIRKIDKQRIELDEFIVSGDGRWVKRQAGIGLSE